MPFLQRFYVLLIAVFLLVAVGGGWYVWHRYYSLEAELSSVFDTVTTITSYTQAVETETVFPDRTLTIQGIYHINVPEKAFASFATTTLTIPDLPPEEREHIFSLSNIAIKDDVYTKIETDSFALQASIPHSPEWRHFTRTTIPEQFYSIAIPGPILDNLKLFSDRGRYVSPLENKGSAELSDGTFTHYTFTLSGERPDTPGGSLHALLDRIGDDGTIDIWVDADHIIRHMFFSNGDYRSTTTIIDINNMPRITAPI